MTHATAFDKPVGSTGWGGQKTHTEHIPHFSSMVERNWSPPGIEPGPPACETNALLPEPPRLPLKLLLLWQ